MIVLIKIILVLVIISALSVSFFSTEILGQSENLEGQNLKLLEPYRVITHLHTSFSHDSRFWSEPNVQLENLKEKGYNAVLVSEHDHSTFSDTQTNFVVPTFQNGGFVKSKIVPLQMKVIKLPRNSAEYLNVTDFTLSNLDQNSFHLNLKGNEQDYETLSWAYWERGEDRIRDRPIGYDLWLKFSVYFSELPSGLDSTTFVCSLIGHRTDVRYNEVSNTICFYFSEESWEKTDFIPLSNTTTNLAIKLDLPPTKTWKTFEINLTDYALQNFEGLEGIPMKYLMLKQITLNQASKNGKLVDVHFDDLQVFSKWTTEEMFTWWKDDLENYSDENFLVIAGLETTHGQDIGAYGINQWYNFSSSESVEKRVNDIHELGAISSITSPRAHNFTNVKEGGGWGANILEIFNTVHDSKPSIQVLKGWDSFLSDGARIYGVAGFDSHGLKMTPGQRNPTVVSEPIYENLVIAKSLSKTDIFSSIIQGQFYVKQTEYPIRMAFSPGIDVLPQVGGVVYIPGNDEKIMNIYLEGVPATSRLVIIHDGQNIQELKILEDPFYKVITLANSNENSYVRFQIKYLDEIIAFSNPIFFEVVSIPNGAWVELDPVFSNSKITSVTGNDQSIRIHLESENNLDSLLKIHHPSKPLGIKVDQNNYIENELLVLEDLIDNNKGWNYDQKNQLLSLKIDNGSDIEIQFPEITEMNNGLIDFLSFGNNFIIIGII